MTETATHEPRPRTYTARCEHCHKRTKVTAPAKRRKTKDGDLVEDVTRRRFERNNRALLAYAAESPESFAVAVELLDALRDGLTRAANAMTADTGASWGDIATELGVTRSAAHQRFGPHRLAV